MPQSAIIVGNTQMYESCGKPAFSRKPYANVSMPAAPEPKVCEERERGRNQWRQGNERLDRLIQPADQPDRDQDHDDVRGHCEPQFTRIGPCCCALTHSSSSPTSCQE